MERQSITHYTDLEEIGRGGMGIVYKARDINLGRVVALKFLSAKRLHSPEARMRFRREAQALSALSHPHIATVYEADEVDGEPFLALEFLAGGTLHSRLRAAKVLQLSIRDVMGWGADLADALAHAHKRRVIHRDIKCSNAMFTEDGLIKLTDFGLAKLDSADDFTDDGEVIGTVAYMSPEQLSGKAVDSRSDLFSLGVTLYEAVTGQLPFASNSPAETIRRILQHDVAAASQLRAEVPHAFDMVLKRLLAKNVEDRYQSAEQVADDLRSLVSSSGNTVIISTITAKTPSTRARKRSFGLALAAIVIAVLLAIAGVSQGVRWFSSSPLPKQKNIAVLPLRSIGGDTRQQEFCDGMTETLTTALNKHGGFWVVPAFDSRRAETVEQMRREFGVNLVIAGTVQRRGDQVRLVLNLIDASQQRQIDSEPIDWPVTHLWDLEDAALAKLADMLNLVVEQRAGLLSMNASQIPAAHDAYLRGRGFLYRYDLPGNLDRAIQQFEDAVARDPRLALAYIGLAEAHFQRYRLREDPGTLLAVRLAAERAIELNQQLGSGHVMLGAALAAARRYPEAIKEFETAIRLDRRDPTAYRNLGNLYQEQEKNGEAEQVYQRAIAARPGDWHAYNQLGRLYFSMQRNADAERVFRKVTELTPDNHWGHWNLGLAQYRLGRTREGEAELRKSLVLRPSAVGYSNLGAMLIFNGQYPQAVAAMETAAQLAPTEAPTSFRLWGNLGDAYWLAKSGTEKARTAWMKAAEIAQKQAAASPPNSETLSLLAKYSAKLGNTKDATAYIAEALKLSPTSATVHYQAGLIFCLLGQNDRSLSELATAVDRGYSLAEIKAAPELAVLRADPRYQQLFSRTGRR